jgi:hypothetical protein
MMGYAKYLQIRPGAVLPNIATMLPFRAVVIAETSVAPEWQSLVSYWLVQSGCLYMMAWGVNCSSWDDSVNDSNNEQFNFGEIPEDKFVMTTWHDKEPLAEVLWFAKNSAFHPSVDMDQTLLLHISEKNRGSEVLRAYADA